MGNYVKYFGTADVRQISVDDWKAAGVEDMETVTWHPGNGYLVPREKFTDAAWPFIKGDVFLMEVSSESVEAGKDADPSVVRETVVTASGGPSGLLADS